MLSVFAYTCEVKSKVAVFVLKDQKVEAPGFIHPLSPFLDDGLQLV